jgi:tRNA 5-methylaminomethyl-2-thiouridine biosynthesis bifunctional protein
MNSTVSAASRQVALSASRSLVCLDLSGQTLAAALQRVREFMRSNHASVHLIWFSDLQPVSLDDLPARVKAVLAPRVGLPGLHRLTLERETDHGHDIRLTVGFGDRGALCRKIISQVDQIWLGGDSHVGLSSELEDLHGCEWRDRTLAVNVSTGESWQLPQHESGSAVARCWLAYSKRAYEAPNGRRALIVGAGISGLTTAAMLAQSGWSVQVLDGGQTHQEHRAAALTPVISSDDNERSRLSRAGALAAAAFWQSMDGVAQACGALQMQRPAHAKRPVELQQQVLKFNMPNWAQWVDSAQASELAQLHLSRGAIWYPGGCVVRVSGLLDRLADQTGIALIDQCAARLRCTRGLWQALDASGTVLAEADIAVVANASDAFALLSRSELHAEIAACHRLAALHALGGEVTFFPEQTLSGGPACVVGGDGYVLPRVDGFCVVGGTYDRQLSVAAATAQGIATNISRAAALLEIDGLTSSLAKCDLSGWAGWRAVLPGRLPAIGPLNERASLWVFTAAASRGLTWSALGAGLICDAVNRAPLALEADLLEALMP